MAYGREHRMFDVPTDYKLDIMPTPPVLENSIDAAYYMAPPFKKAGIGRFYLTATKNDPAKLRLKNRASIADTAIHEGFPGHDWHFKYMTQHADQISNVRWLTPGAVEDSSSMWSDSLAAEGWGLYAEELMAEPVAGRPYGFYSAPEYLYELQGQMMRAVRVRVDVGIHTGRMTFDEARDYFVEHVEFYPGACALTDPDARAACDSAERAIYRYSKWPTQAIAYNLGKNAIISLREERKRNGAPPIPRRAFHERFMRMGTVPVAFFRDVFDSRRRLHRPLHDTGGQTLFSMQRQSARKVGELLAQHQPAAMQPRLERLFLDVQNRARLFRAEPLHVAKNDGRAIEQRHVLQSADERLPHLCAQHLFVGERRPIDDFALQRPAVLLVVQLFRRVRQFLLELAQAGHRGVERDAVNPGRKRRVAAERVDLLIHLQQHVLCNFFGVLTVSEVPERELINFGSV